LINKLKSIVYNKELLWTILFQLVKMIGGMILIKLLATFLNKEEYGYYALIMSISSFILMLPFTAFQQAVSRYTSIYYHRKDYNVFLTSIIFIFTICIIMYIILFSILYITVFDELSIWGNLSFLIILFIISEIYKILFRSINNANRKRKNIAISSILEFFIKIGIILYTHIYLDLNIAYVLFALSIGNFISLVVMYKQNINFIRFTSINIKKLKLIFLRIWMFSYPLLIWAPFGWFRDMSNRWYLDYFTNKETVALFALISSISLIIPTILQSFANSFFIPILYQKENKQKGYIRIYLRYMVSIGILFILFIFIISLFFKKEIILLISDEKYLSVAWMFPYMFLAYGLYMLSMMSNVEIFAHKNTKKLIYASSIPGVISIVCGYFFISYYGLVGAFYNYIITYSSYAFLTFYVVFHYKGRIK